uniref:Uncharacterized protein n=1 Tax=Rhizophora mucronata TaxID=61149 RepID=A0A2P2QWH7_RHIMU
MPEGRLQICCLLQFPDLRARKKRKNRSIGVGVQTHAEQKRRVLYCHADRVCPEWATYESTKSF